MNEHLLPPGSVVCPLCGGETWDNRHRKTTGALKPGYPDWRCQDCKAAGWLNRDGHGWTWKPDTRTSHR